VEEIVSNFRGKSKEINQCTQFTDCTREKSSLSYGGVDIPDMRAMIVIILYNENNIDIVCFDVFLCVEMSDTLRLPR